MSQSNTGFESQGVKSEPSQLETQELELTGTSPANMAKSSPTSQDEDVELRTALNIPKNYESCPSKEEPNPNPTQIGLLAKINGLLNKIYFPKYFLILVVFGVVWGNVWFLTGEAALPGGSWFAIIFLSIFSWIGGEFIGILHLPPLLGMLSVGFASRNLPAVNIAQDLDPELSSTLRNVALAVILCRAGLSLDPQKLQKLRLTFSMLSIIPCSVEAVATAVTAHFLLNYPWLWSFILGFVVAGVSPAVVVPSMLICQEKRLGTNKGIPILLIASGSLDNVTAIAAFGIVLSLTFSTKPLHMAILQGPLEVVIGVTFGILLGTVTWFFSTSVKKGRLVFQCLILLLGSTFAIFGGRVFGFPGAGPLGSLILAFTAANGWRKRGKLDKRIPLIFNTIWLIFQPVLFGLIGSEVKLGNLAGNTIGLGVSIVVIAVAVRSIATFLVTFKSNFNLKEKLFVTLAWIPKATVQATIGPVALDTARQLAAGAESIDFGVQVLTIAVLAILITAPIGAIAISLSSSRLLTREPEDSTAVSI